MSSEMAEEATRNIARGSASRTMFPRLLPGVESGNRFGLRCPECTDQLPGGRTRQASLCAHCIPYVTRCPWHGCRLVCMHESSTLEMLMSSTGGHARADNSLRYAQLSCSVSEVMPREPLWPKTFGLLREKGYVPLHVPCEDCLNYTDFPGRTLHAGHHCGCGLKPLPETTRLTDAKAEAEISVARVVSLLLESDYHSLTTTRTARWLKRSSAKPSG